MLLDSGRRQGRVSCPQPAGRAGRQRGRRSDAGITNSTLPLRTLESSQVLCNPQTQPATATHPGPRFGSWSSRLLLPACACAWSAQGRAARHRNTYPAAPQSQGGGAAQLEDGNRPQLVGGGITVWQCLLEMCGMGLGSEKHRDQDGEGGMPPQKKQPWLRRE